MNGADVSEDWTVAAAQYVLNTSQYSARSLDLSYAVLRRVAEGMLTPSAVHDALRSAYEAGREQYATDVAHISGEFFGALIQICTGAAESPPPPDGRDAAAWLARLAEYSRSVQRDAVRRYERALEELALGVRTPTEVQAELSAEYTRIGLDRVRAAGALYFEVLSRLAEVNAQFEQQSVRALLTSGSLDAVPAITLTGPVGARSTALVTVENTRDEVAVIGCTLLDVRRADGGGPSFAANAEVRINRQVLQPGDEAEIEVGIHLDSARFAAGRRYVSALRLVRNGEDPLEMPIAITPTEHSNAAAAR